MATSSLPVSGPPKPVFARPPISCCAKSHARLIPLSGSWDSTVRVWQISSNLKSFSPLLTIPLPGIINSLQLLVRPSTSFAAWSGSSRTLFASGSSAGDEDEDAADVVTPPAKEKQEQLILVVSVAQEPRLGRWMTLKGEGKDKVRNGVAVVHLKRGTRVKVADVEMED